MDTSLLTEILAGVMTTLLAIIGLVLRQQLVVLKKKLETREETESKELTSLGISMLCDKVIGDIVAETRVLHKASRGYVIRFHNGTFFSGKQPVWKMSCTHESAAKGVSYEMMNLQGIPATGVLEALLPFWGEKVRGVTRIDNPDQDHLDPRKGIYLTQINQLPDSMAKQHLAGQNIKKMINVPLVAPDDGRVIGLFGLDFCEDDQPTPTDLEQFRGAANQIAYKISSSTVDTGC